MRRPVTQPFSSKCANEPMNGVEDSRVFDSNRGQVVDVKKAAVIDFVRRDSPIRQPIPLLVEQLFQLVETFRIAFFAIQLLDRAVECRSHVGRISQQLVDSLPGDFLLAVPFFHRLGVAARAGRQVSQLRDDALQLAPIGVRPFVGIADVVRQLKRRFEYDRPRGRSERKPPLEVGQLQPTVRRRRLSGRRFPARGRTVRPRNGSRILSCRPAAGGCHSMSKKSAKYEPSPFSSTSSHHALPGSLMPMWLGTTSSRIPMPAFRAAVGQSFERGEVADRRIDRAVVDHVVAVAAFGAARNSGDR